MWEEMKSCICRHSSKNTPIDYESFNNFNGQFLPWSYYITVKLKKKSKFKKHSIEEMLKSSKMSKQRKKVARKRVESDANISMNEREVNAELQTLKGKGPIKKSNCTEEEKNRLLFSWHQLLAHQVDNCIMVYYGGGDLLGRRNTHARAREILILSFCGSSVATIIY